MTATINREIILVYCILYTITNRKDLASFVSEINSSYTRDASSHENFFAGAVGTEREVVFRAL